MIGDFLCWLGLHRWGKWGGFDVARDGETLTPSRKQGRSCNWCHVDQRRTLREAPASRVDEPGERFNPRWIVFPAALFVLIDVAMGVATYADSQRWGDVALACLVFFPICMVGAAVLVVLVVAGIEWAMRGDS